jgi:hypothetical protein
MNHNCLLMGGIQLRWLIFFVLPALLAALSIASANAWQTMTGSDEPLLKDSFTDGKPELEWLAYPYFNHDRLRGSIDPTSPEGEPGVGVLDNKNVGGFAALSYAAPTPPSDFHLETWIYAQVTEGDKGPLNGIAFRIDTEGGNFYRVATHFMGQAEISLAYVGKETKHFPEYLARWKGAELPGGAPQTSGWHKLAITVENHQADIYWDHIKLPGGPFPVDRVPSGFIGVYANFVGGLGLAETRIDGLRVWARK